MKITRLGFVLALLFSVLGCTTAGTGSGQLLGVGVPEQPVSFIWTSNDGGISGVMMAAIPEGSFQGQFFQITQQTRVETLAPLWSHWGSGWDDWPYWGGPLPPMYPSPQFVTHYSGKVVATLQSASLQRMRCRFHLMAPARGMSGGGEGECQLSDGRLVRAVFMSR